MSPFFAFVSIHLVDTHHTLCDPLISPPASLTLFSRFYIGCDLCTNWYHGACVGVTEKEALKMDDYICAECKRAQEGSTEELYCICRTPYDEAQ